MKPDLGKVKSVPVSHPINASKHVVSLGVVVALLFGAHASGQTATQDTPHDTREARWLQDLNYFADQFPKREKDFKKLYPRQEFENRLAAIRQSVSKATDSEVILDLYRLVASAHVGHTRVASPSGDIAFHMLPLSMNWFSDGLAIVAAIDAYKDALGTRVLRIGSMTPDQLEAAVAPYISYENETWLHVQSPSFMVMAELLQHLGLTGTDGSVELLLAKADGTEFKKAVFPVAAGDAAQQVIIYDALPIPLPLYRKQPGKYYWYEYLSDLQTLYIQYNVCENDPKLPFAEFTKAMFEYADAHPIERAIVDLRLNGGGNSTVIKPLEKGLHARRALSRRGHLYTLIGPGTFSSGLWAAIDLRHKGAILVGEPPGEKPNSYGEVKVLTLPNSHVGVRYSTKFFKLDKKNDASALAPDIFVPRPLADVLAGRDPVLEAAVKHPLN